MTSEPGGASLPAGSRCESGFSATGTALLTDHYELPRLRAALHSGAAHRRSVFEVFARSLPSGRRYGVAAGQGRLLDALARFRFSDDELRFLTDTGGIEQETRGCQASYYFGGAISASAEGGRY